MSIVTYLTIYIYRTVGWDPVTGAYHSHLSPVGINNRWRTGVGTPNLTALIPLFQGTSVNLYLSRAEMWYLYECIHCLLNARFEVYGVYVDKSWPELQTKSHHFTDTRYRQYYLLHISNGSTCAAIISLCIFARRYLHHQLRHLSLNNGSRRRALLSYSRSCGTWTCLLRPSLEGS